MSDRTESWIDVALQDLANVDRRTVVPSKVKAAVLHAWDAQHAAGSVGRPERNKRRVHTWRKAAAWVLVPAAAASIVAFTMVTRGPAHMPNHRFSTARAADPIEVSSEPPVPPPTLVELGPPQRATLRHFSNDDQATPVESGYVIVPDPFSDATALHVVRVRMARGALAATLGMPMIDPDAQELVEVEILVGDDGIARSIRNATFVADNTDQGAGR